MLFVGDIHIYVSDFTLALRFWAEGLKLEIAEQEVSPHSAFARLDFPDGGSSLRLLAPVDPWPLEARPPLFAVPTVRFDVTTSDFDSVLVRLLEYGGTQVDEIESYNGLRVVTLADPDGNTFELLELKEDAEIEADDAPAATEDAADDDDATAPDAGDEQ
jgi:catechol 2,3-dioxygenase-like lactoylglutathione lyase family enzyme